MEARSFTGVGKSAQTELDRPDEGVFAGFFDMTVRNGFSSKKGSPSPQTRAAITASHRTKPATPAIFCPQRPVRGRPGRLGNQRRHRARGRRRLFSADHQ
jgi:hypothetical protein